MDEPFVGVLVHFRQFAHVFLLGLLGFLADTAGALLAESGRFGGLFAHSSQMEVNEVPHHPGLQQTYGRQTVDPNDLSVEVSFGDIELCGLMCG